MIDPDGITPETCRLAARNRIGWTPEGQDQFDVEHFGVLTWVTEFQLVEFGCDHNGDEYIIRAQDIALGGRGVQGEDIDRALRRVNYVLRQQARCGCARRGEPSD